MPSLPHLRLSRRGRPSARRSRRATWRLTLGFGLGVLGGWLFGLLRAPAAVPTGADGVPGAGLAPADVADPPAQPPVRLDLTGPRSVAGTTP